MKTQVGLTPRKLNNQFKIDNINSKNQPKKESWDDKVSKKDGFFDAIYKSGFSCSGRSLKKLQKASMERCAVYGEF